MNKRTNSDDVIIYKGSHQTVILTHADFPSDEEFEKWYHWINENTTDRRFGRFIALWKDMDFLESPDAEKPFLRQENRRCLWRIAKQNLTAKQYRRLYMHVVKSMTLQEIAMEEGTCFQAIHKSIVNAKKKLREVLKKRN